MNIVDTGSAANAAGAARDASAQAAASGGAMDNAVKAAQQQKAEAQAAASSQARQDEYVADAPQAVSTALYSVSNRNGGYISELNSQLKVGKRTSSGETIDRKVVEMDLPTGRKSLTIYKKSKK